MGRKRIVNPAEIVAAVRSGKLRSAVARDHGISRMRVTQIMQEADGVTAAPVVEETPEQQELVQRTLAALADSHTLADAAFSLGLTSSGLQTRIRRHKVLVEGYAILRTERRKAREQQKEA